MSRAPNFYYKDPMGEIGNSLVRAILGDPAMAAQQRQQQAQDAERAARTRLLTGQAEGVEGQNDASRGLPDLVRAWAAANQPVQEPTTASPGFGDFDTPMPEAPPRADPGSALASMIAAMGQMNGDKVDPTKIVGSLASFLGGDELARRGLIAQGHSPTKDFALTPDRADEIAGIDNSAKQLQAWGVADRNHANDIPVANVRRASAFDVAQVNNRDDVPVARINASGKEPRGIRNRNPGNIEYGEFARSMGATGTDGRFAIFATPEAGVRAQEALLGGSGYLGGGRNTINKIISRYAPAGENSVSNYASYISRVTGIDPNQPITQAQIPAVAEAMRQFENGNYGGSAPAGRRGRGAAGGSAPKPVAASNAKHIETLVGNYFEDHDVAIASDAKQNVVRIAIDNFRRSGNAVGAVQEAVAGLTAQRRAQRSRAAGGGAWGPARVVPQPAPSPTTAVRTLAEAHALDPGTRYQTPDGRVSKR